MLSTKTKQLLSQFLFELAVIELNSEDLRQDLCIEQEFEPYSYFKLITIQSLLDLDSLKEFLTSKQKPFRLQGLIGVMLAHDTDHDGCWHYNDFLRMVLTNDNINLRQEVALREKFSTQIDQQVIHDKFVNLLQYESDCYLRLQNLKESLQKCYDFNAYDCFRIIDVKNQGYIDYDSIRRFLQSNPIQEGSIQENIIRIIRRLNKHQYSDKINYEAFSQHIKSKTNYIQQFSPERLEQTKKECSSANKMYSVYGQCLNQGRKSLNNTSILKNSRLLTTPNKNSNKKNAIHNLSLSQISLSNAFVTPKTKQSHRIHTQMTPVRSSQTFSCINEVLTPVRRTNLKSVQKKKALFNLTVDKEFYAPMRHSPFVIHNHPGKLQYKDTKLVTPFMEQSYRPKGFLMHETKKVVLNRVKMTRTSSKQIQSSKALSRRFI